MYVDQPHPWLLIIIYLAREITFISFVCIEDPVREGVRQAVADCQKAGVAVKKVHRFPISLSDYHHARHPLLWCTDSRP
jgi:hypothetical protein